MSIDAHELPPPHLPRLLEVHEVAFQLRCSQETVLRLIRKRKLAAVRLGMRAWRVDPADLKTWIDAQRVRVQIASAERAIDRRFAAAAKPTEAAR